MTIPIETREFSLVHPTEVGRVIRGKVDGPRGFETARPSLPHVIVMHGFKGFMDWGFFPETSQRIAQRGMVAVRFNTSGSGIGADLATFGEPQAFARSTVSRDLEDLETVRDWLASGAVSGLDPSRCALLGHSRGGALALIHASERRDCRSVIAWAAVASFDRFDAETKRTWRERGFLLVHNARTGDDLRLDVGALDDLERHRDRFDVVAACRRLSIPTLLVHGGADETVTPAALEELSSALDPRIRRTLRIEGAGHTFGVRHPPRGTTAAWEEAIGASLGTIETAWVV